MEEYFFISRVSRYKCLQACHPGVATTTRGSLHATASYDAIPEETIKGGIAALQNDIRRNSCICPYCGEDISMMMDLSTRNQSYIEDCKVCCNPIDISFMVENGNITNFNALPIEQQNT